MFGPRFSAGDDWQFHVIKGVTEAHIHSAPRWRPGDTAISFGALGWGELDLSQDEQTG